MIVVEGIEGSGKSSAIQCVIDTLKRLGVEDIVTTREPGGTPIAESMRSILKHGLEGELPTDQTEVLLMYAARSQLLHHVIWPALKAGKWVIADRHNLSSLAYQGGGRGINQTVMETLSDFCVQGFKPGLTLFLDVDLENSEKRVIRRGQKDRIEQEEKAFFERVRDSYLAYAASDDTIVTIDANQALDVVHGDIMKTVKTWFQA